MKIQVLHFFAPYGQREWQTTEVRDSLKEKYDLIQKLGCRITAEILNGGKVSLCIDKPDLDDIDIDICSNGPEVIEVLERMIENFSEDKYLDFVKRYD
jgi:hypothetical protein